ncbi:predicted protein [Coccidioides posadasii str. Silveira]|uniref:Predicted protein n=1 Tax=Coccidioides posadasii (strain RMSCC 757 / Silveira) TaxID=443226 RepID=E9CSR5_COCPS|nr:predicted protein [Coccidioides posadasii str. Silveira]
MPGWNVKKRSQSNRTLTSLSVREMASSMPCTAGLPATRFQPMSMLNPSLIDYSDEDAYYDNYDIFE